MTRIADGRQLVDLSLAEFADALASDTPAPGGGSAAALAGALGAALAGMVAGLTLGRERYAAHQTEMADVRHQARTLQAQLLALVDADTAAYSGVTTAYRLSKETEEERAARAAAVQVALRAAADVPLETAEACLRVLHLAALAISQGNRNAGSDAFVAALLAHAALQGAVQNVRINLQSIKDAGYRSMIGARVVELLAEGETAFAHARALADEQLA